MPLTWPGMMKQNIAFFPGNGKGLNQNMPLSAPLMWKGKQSEKLLRLSGKKNQLLTFKS